MEISQIIMQIDLNKNDNNNDTYSVKEAVDVFYSMCAKEPEGVFEKNLSFNKFRLFFMKKTVLNLLNNFKALNDDIITFSATRNFDGCNIGIFTPKNSFENKRPINEVLKVDEKDLDVLKGAEHFGFDNKNNSLFLPDEMECDREVDPNYIILGYKYQSQRQFGRIEEFAY